jgi:hypothetical protein
MEHGSLVSEIDMSSGEADSSGIEKAHTPRTDQNNLRMLNQVLGFKMA